MTRRTLRSIAIGIAPAAVSGFAVRLTPFELLDPRPGNRAGPRGAAARTGKPPTRTVAVVRTMRPR